jgi:DNA-binding transcriptional LysR family regulator
MTLQQIYYILTVSECGSLNQAAEKLYVSQPALTSAIQALEAEAHITIFNRTNRGVSLTNEGKDFLLRARQLYQQYELLKEEYSSAEKVRRKFKVSTQHYSFATKAFVETVKKCDADQYDLEICETKTKNVINDVGNSNSEVGILYLSEFNRKYLEKLLHENHLEFHPLIKVHAFVYLYKKHPLALRKSIAYEELKAYPNMSFDQGEEGCSYLNEEILTQNQYPRTIKVNDRATMLNLMRGLNGYTLCSGIISKELNGNDYVAVPYQSDRKNPNALMQIGYITKSHAILSDIAEKYIEELKRYLEVK